MARTSRKGAAKQAAVTPAERVWHTAVYARLSREDSGRKGADTIETQIELITSYVAAHSYLSFYDTYIDNGESGKDFERPAWQRLMDDIRSGRVDCICVKDLSRFSRNYIETIEFLEKIFPFMGVRFISVNDGYDNHTPDSHGEGLLVALKSLVNDQYLRDISRKIHSTVKSRRDRGEYTGSQAPFGYRKMADCNSKLEPDPETAPVLREIFEWRAAGVGRVEICRRLDSRGILTPTEKQRRERGAFNTDFFKATIWREATLKCILHNSAYIGTLSQGKHEQRLFDHKPCTPVPKSDWVITENAHEPLISMELWVAVNAIEDETQAKYAKCGRRDSHDMPVNIFRGFTVCSVCGAKISRLYNKKVNPSGKTYEYLQYKCPLHRQHPSDSPSRPIRSEALYAAVFPAVADQLLLASNLGAVIEKRAKRQENPRALLDAEIAKATRKLQETTDRLAGLYENYADKVISEQEYIRFKADYENGAAALQARLTELSQRAALQEDVSVSNNHWLAAARSFQNPTELTREMLEALVERVVITNTEEIKVVWKFSDELALLQDCAENEEGGVTDGECGGVVFENIAG